MRYLFLLLLAGCGGSFQQAAPYSAVFAGQNAMPTYGYYNYGAPPLPYYLPNQPWPQTQKPITCMNLGGVVLQCH